ncbi:MAG: hypothetical protein J7J92_04035 [Candidatus Aenigmarchaeota archaeon]|nr:hypothetical protein [Candidatus Aenigmarchaeota archaeon]
MLEKLKKLGRYLDFSYPRDKQLEEKNIIPRDTMATIMTTGVALFFIAKARDNGASDEEICNTYKTVANAAEKYYGSPEIV